MCKQCILASTDTLCYDHANIFNSCAQIIDGFSPKILPDPPERARLAAEDNKSEMWQEATWKAILDPKAPQELIQAGAKVCYGRGCGFLLWAGVRACVVHLRAGSLFMRVQLHAPMWNRREVLVS